MPASMAGDDVAPSSPICIESDVEDASRTCPTLEEAPVQDLLSSCGGGELEEPSSRIVCQMMVPAECVVGALAVKTRQRMRSVGAVAMTFQSTPDNGDVLEFKRMAGAAAATSVSTMSVSQMEIQCEWQRQTTMITLKFDPPVEAGELIPSSSSSSVPKTEDRKQLGEIALVARAEEVRALFSTLRAWVPHVIVQGLPRRPLPAPDLMERMYQAAAVLRFDGIQLTAQDIELLDEETCLNDSVLEFFLRLVMDVVAPAHLRNDLYVASTFFFNKLTSGDVENGELGWDNVSRWNRSLQNGILNQRFVLVPINESNIHWYAVVMCHPGQALIQPIDSPDNMNGEAPRIVCLDSAGEPASKNRAVGFLRGYIWREYSERYPDNEVASDEHAYEAEKLEKVVNRLQAVVADVPKQENGYDCGVFVIEYLLHLLQSRSALAGLGLAPHQHWFGQAAVSHRRRRLRWIATELQKEAKRRQQTDVGILLSKNKLLRDAVTAQLVDGARPKRKAAEMDSSPLGS